MVKGITKKMFDLATKLGGIDNKKSFECETYARDLLVNKATPNLMNNHTFFYDRKKIRFKKYIRFKK